MTDWTELLVDPRTIRAIFGQAPSLEQVELVSIVLNRDGPMATLSFELAEFPVDPPKKWREAGFNAVQVRLQALGVRALEIRGLETTPILDLRLQREGDLLRVSGATDVMSIDITAEFLDVFSDGVSAYQVERLICAECGAEAGPKAKGWTAHFDDEDAVVLFCPDCAERETRRES